MFENNQLALPLAYILVLGLCLFSLVLLSLVRWLERDLCGKPKFGFHALFGVMLTLDFLWALLEYNGLQTRFLTFGANSIWCCLLIWICYRWHEDCLENLKGGWLGERVPRWVRALPVLVSWLLIGGSWWTGLVTGVSATGCYCRGPYLWVVYAVAVFYLLATVPICAVAAWRSRERMVRGAALSCLMASVALILSALLQYGTGFAFIFIGVIITMAIIDFGALHKALAIARAKTQKSVFTAVSHEIRTPLNAIIGFAELLEEERSEPRRRAMERSIVESGRALAELFNNAMRITHDEESPSVPAPAPVPPAPKPSVEALAPAASDRKRRILVVDDVTLNRTVIAALLKRLGHEDVTLAGDGEEALALLKAGPDRYDLVLTDLQMPKMAGDELVREIRADSRLAKLQVHVVTADVQARTHCAHVGFDSILIKPVTIAKLSQLLQTIR